MKLIVGLGNPGKEYEKTRHNVGWLFLDFLAQQEHFSEFRDTKMNCVLATGEFNGEKVLLCKPLSYMNLSGEPVRKVMDFYKIPITDIIVISDDLDMEFGKVRYRAQGSSGGHNGLKSLTQHLGTETYHRIKIGIGRHPHMPVSDWVLSRFTENEIQTLTKTLFASVSDELDHVPKLWK